jgi:hypothetical protein
MCWKKNWKKILPNIISHLEKSRYMKEISNLCTRNEVKLCGEIKLSQTDCESGTFESGKVCAKFVFKHIEPKKVRV